MAKTKEKPVEYSVILKPLSKQNGRRRLVSMPATTDCIDDGEMKAEALAVIRQKFRGWPR